MHRLPLALVVACLVLLTASCSGITDPSDNTVEDFTATLLQGTPSQPTGNVHLFEVKRAGEYSAALIALAPDAGAAFNIYLGQDSNGFCVQVGQSGIARMNAIALNSSIQKGRYCLQVFDQGFIPRDQTYTLRVSHP